MFWCLNDVVRLAQETNLSCIEGIKMDAVRPAQMESTEHDVYPVWESFGENLIFARLNEDVIEDNVVRDTCSHEADNVIQECSKGVGEDKMDFECRFCTDENL